MLWGIDNSEEGVRILHHRSFHHIIHGDVEQMAPELRKEKFDIILAGEIIEHLANPGLFLQCISSIMDGGTELVLTTPNAPSVKGFLFSIMRQEKVHPDHNYYFSYRTLKQLLEKFDLNCKEIYYYQEIEGQGLSRALDNTVAFATWLVPLWADGLIVRATV
jgi:predicted TPR repeat methyltransferase